MIALPDSWTWGFAPTGAGPSFTLPAIPGVSHVLTDFVLYVYTGSTANSGIVISANVSIGGGAVSQNLGVLATANAGNAVWGPLTWSGKIVAPVGKSMLIATNAWPGALTSGICIIGGYAI